MAIRKTTAASPPAAVHLRRAYFDCRFGQLHVRTAFSPSGGFDERTTLLCLHPLAASGRMFDSFLPLIATDRSVYAPDLPGCGESDPAPQPGAVDFAAAMSDLVNTLRIRKIDILSCGDSTSVAAELSRSTPELVRKRLDLADREAELLAAQPDAVVRRVREHLGN